MALKYGPFYKSLLTGTIMLLLAFFVMAVLHFGGIVTLPLWLVFAPLVLWIFLVFILGIIVAWAKS